MPDPFLFISKYIWVVFIAMSLFQFRAPPEVRERAKADSAFGQEHRRLRRNILLWMNTPWGIVGMGIISGSVPNIWSYFRPRDMNPFVLVFFGSVIIHWFFDVYWTFNGGAEKITEHELLRFDFFGKRIKLSPEQFKIVLIMAILGGLAGLGFILMLDIQIPPM